MKPKWLPARQRHHLWVKSASALAIAALALLPFRSNGAEDSLVPKWFEKDPAKPFAIFEAWKHLSTPDASDCSGAGWADSAGWAVLGGILCDPDGRPLPATPVELTHFDGQHKTAAEVTSDSNGHFLIYSPPCLNIEVRPSPEELRKLSFRERLRSISFWCELTACPGYPASRDGWAYANAKGEVHACVPKLLMQQEDQLFYQFTVAAGNSFDSASFEHFKTTNYARISNELRTAWQRDPWRPKPTPKEPSEIPSKVYRLRIVDDHGKPIPKVTVIGGSQIVETDKKGYCRIEKSVPAGADLRLPVRARLSIDVPGGVIGPIEKILRRKALNVIELPPAATVSGRLVDQSDRPVTGGITIDYNKPNSLIIFEGAIPVQPDGTFSFNRVMPEEKFRLMAEGAVGGTGFAPAWTEYYALHPGAKLTNIAINVGQAAAIRGIVVDRSGKAVSSAEVTLIFNELPKSEDWRHSTPIHGAPGRFGFDRINQKLFRLRVQTPGFREYLSSETRLDPGELRFWEITLEQATESIRK